MVRFQMLFCNMDGYQIFVMKEFLYNVYSDDYTVDMSWIETTLYEVYLYAASSFFPPGLSLTDNLHYMLGFYVMDSDTMEILYQDEDEGARERMKGIIAWQNDSRKGLLLF